MALTPGRWIALATVGCAALVMYLALPSGSNRERMPNRRLDAALTADRLSRAVGQSYYRWTSLARRDSLTQALPASHSSNRAVPAISFDSRLQAPQRTVFERAVSRHWRSLGIDSVRIPVTIAVVLDTAEISVAPGLSRRYLNYEYHLPTRDAETCVSVVVIGDRNSARTEELVRQYDAAQARGALLGPCAFFAAFGRPGAEIDRWLRGRAYRFANNPRWLVSSEPSAMAYVGSRRFGDYGILAPDPWRSLGWSPDALACAGGVFDRCAATGLGATREPDRITRSGLVQRRYGGDGAGWSGTTDDYLSDLATRLGPERFGKFWRSPLPVDAALQEASGMTVPEWTHQWAVQFFGERTIGPSVGLIGTIAMLLASAAGLIGACAVAMRRQLR